MNHSHCFSKKSLKEKLLRSITILTLLIACLAFATCATALGRKQHSEVADKNKPKTLRERALERDIEFDRPEGHDFEYGDLRLLAEHSDAIVLGRILEEESYFSGDYSITTRYKVDVQRIVKDGTAEAGRLSQSIGMRFPEPLITPLRFTRWGGTVLVNGHRASVRVKGSELLTSNKTYVLFLQWTGGNYHIAGSMSGAVLIDDDFRIRPLGTKEALKLEKYYKLALDSFIEEVLKEPMP